MLFCLYHIANANLSLGPEAKLPMLVCVITSPSLTLGALGTVETNDTHCFANAKANANARCAMALTIIGNLGLSIFNTPRVFNVVNHFVLL